MHIFIFSCILLHQFSMKKDNLTFPQIKITLLQKIDVKTVFKLALADVYSDTYFKSYQKQFNSPILLFAIQKSTTNSNWILLKSEQQVLKFIEQFTKSENWLIKKIKKIENVLNVFHKKEQYNQTIDFQDALNQICRQKQIMANSSFLDFIQLSKSQNSNAKICKSFVMLKQSGGRYNQNKCCKIGALINCKKRRQICFQVNGIIYKNQQGQIRQYMPFNYGFQYFYGKPDTNREFGIILLSNHRRLILQAENINDFLLFLFLLKKLVKQSPYMHLNRFYSFSPIRYKNKTKFFVDGKDYFQSVSKAIENAQKSIFITGWMISPQFLLQRIDKQQKSLQSILKIAADKSVKIYILLYWQSSFLPNDSAYVKQRFQQLSQNIYVIRHPNNSLPVLWSHHSKMIIIDNQIAFFGGLDLCYGRYDDKNHLLFQQSKQEGIVYPGIQYNNARIKDITNVRQYYKDHVERINARLPWHDIGQCVSGQIVSDFTAHFIQIWNFTSYQSKQQINKQILDKASQVVQLKSLFTFQKIQSQQIISQDKQSQNGIKQTFTNGFKQIKRKGYQKIKFFKKQILPPEQYESLQSSYRKKINKQNKQNNFKIYFNQIKKQVDQINSKQQEKTKESLFIRRLPSTHRSSLQKVKNSIKIQKHNKSHGKRASLLAGDKLIDLIALQIDSSFVDCLQNLSIQQNSTEVKHNYTDHDIDSDQQQQIFQKIASEGKQSENLLHNFFIQQNDNFQCQLVRSVGNWSIGCSSSNTQFSIHIAYIQLISQAKYYIYIQNQFFISSTSKDDQIKNEVVNALFKRIRVAYLKSQTFRVYVMIPLLPGFAGDLLTEQCKILRIIMEYHYSTIRNLIQRLRSQRIDPQDYIQFYSLRNHGVNKINRPFTEIIYIHSKLMIIDDNQIICGSANINDRSLLGDRDSEIAVVTRQDDMSTGVMNGQNVIVSQNGKQLRLNLWNQHFGLCKQLIDDPISQKTWSHLKTIAKTNTNIYRTIFGCYPDNTISTLKQVRQLKNQSLLESYDSLKERICGHVVQYPYKFLSEQKVQNNITQMEYYLPTVCLI